MAEFNLLDSGGSSTDDTTTTSTTSSSSDDGGLLSGLGSEAKALLSNPRAWLAGVLVGWLFDLWEAFLGYVETMWSVLAGIPELAIYRPIATAFGMPGAAIQDAWREVGTIAVDVSEVAGPFAPIVVVGVWMVPALLGASAIYFLVGFASTYLPLEGLPVIRRFV